MNENEQLTVKQKDYRFYIFILQIVACLTILAVAVILRLFGGDLYLKLSKFYNKEISQKTTVTEVIGKDEPDKTKEKTESYKETPSSNSVVIESNFDKQDPKAEDTANNSGYKVVPVSATILNKTANSLLFPVSGVITSKFGDRDDPFFGSSEYHKGIDIAVAHGTGVKSSLDGVVKETGYNNSYGYYIIVKHSDSFATLYAHCSEIKAKENDSVKQGQVVALSGNTGKSTGPHLHFETIVNGEKVNPLIYLTEI